MGRYSAGLTPRTIWGNKVNVKPVFPRVVPVSRSKRAGWFFRGVTPLNATSTKTYRSAALIHALGMMPGLPELTPPQVDKIRVVVERERRWDAALPDLRKWELVREFVRPVLVEAMRDMLDLGPVMVDMPWYSHFDLVNLSGYSAIGPESSLYTHQAVIVGWHPGRNAYRILNSRGPHWGALGRSWIDAVAFEELMATEDGRIVDDADIVFPVSAVTKWSPKQQKKLNAWRD